MKPKPDHRHTLHFGPYAAPKFRLGGKAVCSDRGDVIVCGLTDGRISWPLGRLQGNSARGPIIYRDLARAIRRESASAICFWWGVTPQTVSKWRRVLGVKPSNEGERLLRAANGRRNWPKVKPKFHAKARDPERRRKISATKLGKPRPAEVVEKMRRSRLGTSLSPASRKKMSEAHKARGSRPPWIGPAWSAKEDAIALKHSAKEAARLTGRTETAVYMRRQALRRIAKQP